MGWIGKNSARDIFFSGNVWQYLNVSVENNVLCTEILTRKIILWSLDIYTIFYSTFLTHCVIRQCFAAACIG